MVGGPVVDPNHYHIFPLLCVKGAPPDHTLGSLFRRLGRLRRGTKPSDFDGSHAEAGTFCALRRPSLISNRRRDPRHPHYPSRAQGLIALAVKRLPRTRGAVEAGEALERLASVNLSALAWR